MEVRVDHKDSVNQNFLRWGIVSLSALACLGLTGYFLYEMTRPADLFATGASAVDDRPTSTKPILPTPGV